jgi:hypothetical protein
MSGLPIEILGNHPHAGERGVIASTETAKRMGRALRTPAGGRLVALDNCEHGTECCYVWPGEFRTVCERRS